MTDPAPPLSIALLGPGATAFAQALRATVHGLLPKPSRALHWRLDGPDLPHADLRWLLAWEDEPGADAEASIAALAAHQRLRQSLHAQGLSYQVLRGSLPEKQAQALQALANCLPELGALLPQTGVKSRRPGWTCSDCSDPDCEHRSFTALLAGRQSGP